MARPLRALLLVLPGLTACGESQMTGPPPSPPAPPTPVVTTVTVSPATISLTVGGTATLTAGIVDQNGAPMTGKSVVWTVTPTAVATISTGGAVTAVAAGSATVTATVDGKSGTATVTVTGGGSNPPTGEFQTTVPPIEFNVIPARPTATSITLSLYSRAARTVTLTLIGENRTVLQTLASDTPTLLELTGLGTDKLYRYRIDGPSPSYTGAFRTARARGATYRFAMQADSHLDVNSDVTLYTNTLRNMVADSADFLVDLGDTFMSDKYPDFRNAAAQYYAQRHYFGIVGNLMPTFLVQGNHDAESGFNPSNATWAASQRTRWFPPMPQNDFYSMAVQGRNYYAWRWGEALHIALDPYAFTMTKPGNNGNGWVWTLGKEQYDWLVAQLKANTLPYTFVYLHHLVGGKGGSEARGGVEVSHLYEWGGANLDGTPGFATNRPGWVAPLHDLFVQYKVSAVFHGHDHLWVNQLRDGIRYLEVPQPSFARENATASAPDYGYVTGTILGSSGHVRVTVAPDKATVEYVRSRLTTGNGLVADKFDIAPARRP